MSPTEIEAYVHEHIPLSKAMGLRIVEAGPARVVLEAPLGPNLNHRSTAFGGSVSASMILAGWTYVHVRLRHEEQTAQTVIQESAVRYAAPIHASFRVVTEPVEDRAWDRFRRMLARYGRGRVRVVARVESEGMEAARFEGAYVAIEGRYAD